MCHPHISSIALGVEVEVVPLLRQPKILDELIISEIG